jgi:hypothetical protein
MRLWARALAMYRRLCQQSQQRQNAQGEDGGSLHIEQHERTLSCCMMGQSGSSIIIASGLGSHVDCGQFLPLMCSCLRHDALSTLTCRRETP